MRAALLVGLLGSAACVDHREGIKGTQSLDVEVTSPTDVGTPDDRLDDNARDVTIDITAHGPDGSVDTTFNGEVQVYAQFLGTLTPSLGSIDPLARITLTNGVATGQKLTLPAVFGPTTVWVDDGDDDQPTYATGTSPTLWYRDPTVRDIQKPANEMGLAALTDSPLENKTIAVDSSRTPGGHLLVTSVFSQGYTVSDVVCSTAGQPCTAGAYDHVEVFSFSAPQDGQGRLLQVGQFIDGFNGGVSEFNGLTEIGFPQTFVAAETPDVDPTRLPVPVVFQAGRAALSETMNWFSPLSSYPDGVINFEMNEAAPIEVDQAVVCMLDDDYTTYKQWKLDPNGTPGAPEDCSNKKNIINVVTAGLAGFDPAPLVGKKLSKVYGVLRPVEIGSFNVWLIYPRSVADVVQ